MDQMGQIYDEYAKMVYGFLLTKTCNPDLAEELTQETFYQAIRGIKEYKGEGKISTWLCGIAKNLWYESVRRQKVTKSQEELGEATELSVPSVEQETFCNWESVELLKCLHRLEDPMREVMYLRISGNLSFAQIGEIMDKSENWARVTYYRGKERLVKEVKKL